MPDRRARDLLRHKRILVAVRLVFFIMISSLALPDFLKGTISPVLPIMLAAYLITNLAMAFEKSQTFLSQRVQAFLILFDLATLVTAMAFMERYRQDLFLAMFLVVLLASAGQRLTVSIGGFFAVAASYIGFTAQSQGGLSLEGLGTMASGLPVLLVVAIYVGYVTENVARERRRRELAEEHLTRELQGMMRLQSLGAAGLAEQNLENLLGAAAETARALLDAPRAAIFWKGRDDKTFRHVGTPGFAPETAARWAADEEGVFRRALEAPGVLVLPAEHPACAGFGEILLAPLEDRVDGTRSLLAVAWDRPHDHLKAEEQALQVLAQQSGMLLENASLYRLLTQTRDLWQSAFQSIPLPVVIVDPQLCILQANAAFLRLGGFDLPTLVGTPFLDMLEGALTPEGRPAGKDTCAGAMRLHIPKLNGDFEVIRGPYQAAAGMVWLLRKVDAATLSATP